MISRMLKIEKNAIVPKCWVADSFFNRLIGLMFRSALQQNEGLFFPNCNSIHTCFMRLPIDVVFISSGGGVVAVETSLGPWRWLWPKKNARHVLELPENRATSIGIVPGVQLSLEGFFGEN